MNVVKTIHLIRTDGTIIPTQVKSRQLMNAEVIEDDGLTFILRGIRDGIMRFEQASGRLVLS